LLVNKVMNAFGEKKVSRKEVCCGTSINFSSYNAAQHKLCCMNQCIFSFIHFFVEKDAAGHCKSKSLLFSKARYLGHKSAIR
jgi:hypothetical protein